eukprot:jgi/Chlat1/8230/Chrsp77S07681
MYGASPRPVVGAGSPSVGGGGGGGLGGGGQGHPGNNPNSVFVGGISWQADEASLAQFFSTFGPVVSCKIIVDRETAKSKGYGFVTFADADTCTRVKRMERIEFMGKTMNIGDAVRSNRAPGSGMPGGGGPQFGQYMSRPQQSGPGGFMGASPYGGAAAYGAYGQPQQQGYGYGQQQGGGGMYASPQQGYNPGYGAYSQQGGFNLGQGSGGAGPAGMYHHQGGASAQFYSQQPNAALYQQHQQQQQQAAGVGVGSPYQQQMPHAGGAGGGGPLGH